MQDNTRMGELGMTGVDIRVTDSPSWRCHTMLEKEWVGNDLDGIHQAGDREVNHYIGNTLMNQGGGIMWQRLIGITPTTSATGATMQAFSTANAGIGVGDSTADVAVTQTDLQAPASSASRWIKGMQASYPSNSTVNFATSSGAREVQFRSQFSTTEGNFAWEEWGVLNDPNSSAPYGAAIGTMLNRKLQSLGSKTTSATWTFTVTLSLA